MDKTIYLWTKKTDILKGFFIFLGLMGISGSGGKGGLPKERSYHLLSTTPKEIPTNKLF